MRQKKWLDEKTKIPTKKLTDTIFRTSKDLNKLIIIYLYLYTVVEHKFRKDFYC